MDIEDILTLINADRSTHLRLYTDNGKVYDIPPGTRAYDHGNDTLFIVWPGDLPHQVKQSVYIAVTKVSKVEHVAAA